MASILDRSQHLEQVAALLEQSPVVMILGARQVGKTTLAGEVTKRWQGPATLLDLEDPRQVQRLEDPLLALEPLDGLVVLDEVHRRPEIFPSLRVLADRPGTPARFLLLGSASLDLLRQGSESLAGRIAFHDLGGFDLAEVGAENLDDLWVRGAFPRAYLAPSVAASARWREDFVRTFLERDLPQLGVGIPSEVLGRFWSMLAHLHGEIWNASRLASAFGVAHTTVRRYLDLMCHAFVARQLAPWAENIGKRQVRSPKVFLADSGLLHTLLGLKTMDELLNHPTVGRSWEGFLIDQIARRLGARPRECHFWRTHAGAELDLLVVRGPHRRGFEIKRTDSPSVTSSMRSAMETLGLDRLDVVHAGRETYPLTREVRALAACDLLSALDPIG